MKTALVILGMHRSSTSMVAGCLAEAGVRFGRNLIPVNDSNPTGYWELAALNVTHDRLLGRFGLSWDSPGMLPPGWEESPEAGRAVEDLAELVRGEFGDAGLLGIKDPRLCRFVPLWRRVFGRLGVGIRWIHVIREPEAVARSLARRGGMRREHALGLWASYNLNVIADLRPSDETVALTVEGFLADPAGSVLACLGGEWPPGVDPERAAGRVAGFCRSDLQHHADVPGGAHDPAARLYRWMAGGDRREVSPEEIAGIFSQALGAGFGRLAEEERRLAERTAVFARGRPPVVAQFFPMDADGGFSDWDTAYAPVAPFTWTEVAFSCDSEDLRRRDSFRLDPSNACGEIFLRDFRWVARDGREIEVDFSECAVEGDGREISRSRTGLFLHALGDDPRVLFRSPADPPEGTLRLEGRIRFEPKLRGMEGLVDDLEATREENRSLRSRNETLAAEAEAARIRSGQLGEELATVRAEFDEQKERLRCVRTAGDLVSERYGTEAGRVRRIRDSLAVRLGKDFFGRHFPGTADRRARLRRQSLWTAVRVGADPESLRGPLEELVRTGWFDFGTYLAENPDVAGSPLNPLEHYLLHGSAEGRRPSPFFDPAFYRESHPDVAAAGAEPLLHYWLHGRAEGRLPKPGGEEDAVFAPAGFRAGVEARKTRVVFWSGEPHTPGHVYRIDRIRETLDDRNFEVAVFGAGQEAEALPALAGADWLWIWRAPAGEPLRLLVETARGHGAAVHYDLDDLMIWPELADPGVIDGIRSMELKAEETFDLYARTQQAFLLSDQASAPTPTLVAEMSRFYVPTIQVPNGFSSGELVRAREAVARRPADGRLRIGYACGSRTHQRDFRKALPGLLAVLRKYPEAVFVTFPDAFLLGEFPELEEFSDRIEGRAMVPVPELIGEYARFDINLAPVETGNRFCEAKSELKYFEAALVGTPTIASPARPFRDAIRHGENGLLADSEAQWEEALLRLAGDPGERGRMAARAREEVLWLFGPHRRSLLVRRALGTRSRKTAEFASEWAHHLARIPERAGHPESRDHEVLFREETHRRSRVTVVMPVFNYAQYLPEALESLGRQSLVDLDLVVVDDGSTDDSVAVALEWCRNNRGRFGMVAVLRHRANSKLGAARNTGVRFAETEYFFPLDPDNWLFSDCLAECIAEIDRSAAAFVYPDLKVIGSNRHVISGVEWHPLRLTSGNYIDAMALVRKSAWVALGGYATDPKLLGWEDFEFWCKAAEAGFHGRRLPRRLAAYRVHDQSMLKEITDRSEFKRGILEKMERIHPWLDLSRE